MAFTTSSLVMYSWTLIMVKKTTYERLLLRTLDQVNKHTQKNTLVHLMKQQVSDDTFFIEKHRYNSR